MNRLFIALTAIVISGMTNAETNRSITALIDEPASIFDLGMHKLEHYVEKPPLIANGLFNVKFTGIVYTVNSGDDFGIGVNITPEDFRAKDLADAKAACKGIIEATRNYLYLNADGAKAHNISHISGFFIKTKSIDKRPFEAQIIDSLSKAKAIDGIVKIHSVVLLKDGGSNASCGCTGSLVGTDILLSCR